MRGAILAAGLIAAPFAAMAGAAAYDATGPVTRSYATDWTFTGHRVVVEQAEGRLGFRRSDKIVGYYLAGSPHFIGFGCDDAEGPVIAIDEDELSHCQRVERITRNY